MSDNRFFLMRHGQSQANVKGVICSDPAQGRTVYGLTEMGRYQVRRNAEEMRMSGQWHQECALVTSPFLRAVQTAEIVAEILGIPKAEQDERLRERFFGDLEGQSDSRYQQVWQQDQKDARHTQWQVESVDSVAARACALVNQLEQQHEEKTFVLVTHGDLCSILSCALDGENLRFHRQHTCLDPGTCCPLITRPGSR